jgi:hypothetical protein
MSKWTERALLAVFWIVLAVSLALMVRGCVA